MGPVTTPEGSTAAPGLTFGTLLSRFAAAGALAGALSGIWLLLVTERTIEPALAMEVARKALAVEPGGLVRPAGRAVQLDPALQARREQLALAFEAGGFAPPSPWKASCGRARPAAPTLTAG